MSSSDPGDDLLLFEDGDESDKVSEGFAEEAIEHINNQTDCYDVQMSSQSQYAPSDDDTLLSRSMAPSSEIFCQSQEEEENDDLRSVDSTATLSEDEDERDILIRRLEDIAQSLVAQLAECMKAQIPISSYSGNEEHKDGRSQKPKIKKRVITLELADRRKPPKENGDPQIKQLVFPRRTQAGSSLRKIAMLLTVVDIIHEALHNGICVTKRDIYYRDVALFKRQSVVDDLVDDLAATLGVERDDLLVRASAKGLFCGSVLSLRLQDGSIVTGNDTQPSLIPNGSDIQDIILEEDIGWVLIVEKEAIFQTLCQVGFASKFENPGLLLTGKGYPDISTRQLVHKLSTGLPTSIPIVALVDSDPFGVDILACYAFGSEKLRHQRDTLTADRIEWLGLRFSELGRLDIPRDKLIPITENDERKITALLGRDESIMPEEWKQELRSMLDARLKAEIEIVCDVRETETREIPLVQYLGRKMGELLG